MNVNLIGYWGMNERTRCSVNIKLLALEGRLPVYGVCFMCGYKLSTYNNSACCFKHYTDVKEHIVSACTSGITGNNALRAEILYEGGYVE